MDAQMLLLYILILINQIAIYGVLIFLIASSGKFQKTHSMRDKKVETFSKKQVATEDGLEKSGKYLDYINKFEVEA